MKEIREEFKNILFMGLGAISLTGEKATELKKELLEKGEVFYQEGMIKNEELKRELKDKIKEHVTVEVTPTTKEEMAQMIQNMSEEELNELKELLKETPKSNKKKIDIQDTTN